MYLDVSRLERRMEAMEAAVNEIQIAQVEPEKKTARKKPSNVVALKNK